MESRILVCRSVSCSVNSVSSPARGGVSLRAMLALRPRKCKPLFGLLTFEHPFVTVGEQMYATGYGIRPLRSARRMRPIGRLAAVMLLALSVSLWLGGGGAGGPPAPARDGGGAARGE